MTIIKIKGFESGSRKKSAHKFWKRTRENVEYSHSKFGKATYKFFVSIIKNMNEPLKINKALSESNLKLLNRKWIRYESIEYETNWITWKSIIWIWSESILNYLKMKWIWRESLGYEANQTWITWICEWVTRTWSESNIIYLIRRKPNLNILIRKWIESKTQKYKEDQIIITKVWSESIWITWRQWILNHWDMESFWFE